MALGTKKYPNPTDIHIGSRIRTRRMILKMSQEKLGDAVGLTFQQIQKYEKGANRVGGGRMQQFANILDVPVSFFFEGGPAEKTTAHTKSIGIETAFFQTSHATALAEAYINIKDNSVRIAIVALVKAFANSQE